MEEFLLTKKDLTELISAYKKRKIEVKDFDYEQVVSGFGINSKVYKIFNIDTGSPFTSDLVLFLKVYLTKEDKMKGKNAKYTPEKITFRLAKLDELSEKAFYAYANESLKWYTLLGEEKRTAPYSLDRALPPANATRIKLDKHHMLLLIGYKNGNLRELLKRLKEEKEREGKELKWHHIKDWIFDPLVLLWVKGTAEKKEIEKHMPDPRVVGRLEHENKIYAPSSETLAKRYAGYYSLILEELAKEEPKAVEEIVKDAKTYFRVLAPYVAADELKEEEKRALRSVIHGDCFWKNYIGDCGNSVLIDFTNFRISSWLGDVAALLGNPYITEELKLKFEPAEIIETLTEKIIKAQNEMGVRKIQIKRGIEKLLVHSYRCELLYTQPRGLGLSFLYRKEAPQAYQSYLQREPKSDFYNWLHFKNTEQTLLAILKDGFSDESKRAAELGLKVHERLVRLGLFKGLEEAVRTSLALKE